MLLHPFKDNILCEPAPKSVVLKRMRLPASGYTIPPKNKENNAGIFNEVNLIDCTPFIFSVFHLPNFNNLPQSGVVNYADSRLIVVIRRISVLSVWVMKQIARKIVCD